MTRVKIVCNPYLKEISYHRWNGECWVKVTPETSSSSKLVGEEFTTGFFPFKVKKIVDELLCAYYANSERIDLTFTGTSDDYQELALICESEEYKEKIICHPDDYYLNNARDIIDEVSGIFGGLRELIEGSVEDKSQVQADLDRYSEAASEMIPICVFGNVSSGKSSFINALIGNEILPSGDEPITAKVYKITKSEDQNRAFICLSYDGKPIQVLFDEIDRIQTELLNNPLVDGIRQSLEESKGERVPVRVGAALAFINRYGVDENGCEEQERVSDLIELEVPYDEDGILKDSSNKYILFDTPGSNSASNEKHKEVLMNAMRNLTNGIPIFVATSDTLDTEDNIKLYDEIRKYEELVDSRFTMIVVNKADKAKLPKGGFEKEQMEDILRQAIPRKMYAFGIYYVSSIMGLGAKIENNGDFVDDNYARIYMTERMNFSEPKGRFYTQLYKYDILPGQMKAKAEEISAECSNLVYANSGLYWLEKAIELFATNYSAYNKCQQSQCFLRRVLEHTRLTIDAARVNREALKEQRDAQLQQDTKALQLRIEDTIESMKAEFTRIFDEDKRKAKIEATHGISMVELQFLEEKFTEKTRGETGYLDKKLEAEKTQVSFWEKLLGNKQDGINLAEVDHEVDKTAADELFEEVKCRFSNAIASANQMLNKRSMEYWQQCAAEMRAQLLSIITEEDSLLEAKKNELLEAISTYQEVPLENSTDTIFLREDFDKFFFSFGSFKFGETYKLNLTKLGTTFNTKLNDYVDRTYLQISYGHRNAFVTWSDELFAHLCEHLQEMSPMLIKLVKEIQSDTEKIVDLENRQGRLTEYVNQIENLMNWKTR
ncbi:MAG: dynamin family protein [Acetatifactor sp.]